MGKKVLIALLLILVICSGLAFADLTDAENKLSEIESNIVIAMMPFDGANGVNMRDTRYPLRENVVTPGNNPVSTDELDYAGGTSLNNYIGATTSNQYCDQQMILLGGVESVPTNEFIFHADGDLGLTGQYRIKYTTDLPNPVHITFNSSTDFMYVSQSNPIYQRPYAVHVARRYALSDNQTTISGTHNSDPFITLDNDNYFEGAELEMHQGGENYTSSWFDLVLALPYDSVNSITETGVTYKNIEYPLNDTADYSSVLTVTLSLEQPYIIQYRETMLSEWQDLPGTEGILSKSTSMAVPFSGFSSTIETGPSDATASLTISLFPAASNLSLNNADTNREVKVAELDFIMNLPDYYTVNYENNQRFYDSAGTEITGILENVWLFLSASPDPFSSNSNGFVLVHENAGNMLTSYNSATYEVITRGIGNSAASASSNNDGEVIFDGKAKAGDFDTTGISSIPDYIHTHCNLNDDWSGTYLPSQGRKDDLVVDTIDPWWGDPYDVYGSSYLYHHYHEYRGEVYVKIEPTALKPEGMRAGRYTSEIYVHVMTTD